MYGMQSITIARTITLRKDFFSIRIIFRTRRVGETCSIICFLVANSTCKLQWEEKSFPLYDETDLDTKVMNILGFKVKFLLRLYLVLGLALTDSMSLRLEDQTDDVLRLDPAP